MLHQPATSPGLWPIGIVLVSEQNSSCVQDILQAALLEHAMRSHRHVVVVLDLQRAQVIVLVEAAALQVLVYGQLPHRLRQV